MNAKQIVDRLLEGDEAEEVFNSYLMNGPELVFDGPGAWKPYRSEVGDNELSMGERLLCPHDPKLIVDVNLWIHPLGSWTFRVGMEKNNGFFGKREETRMMTQDLEASTPEQKHKLIAAIQEFMPQARDIISNYKAQYGKDIEWVRQALYTPFCKCFNPLYRETYGYPK